MKKIYSIVSLFIAICFLILKIIDDIDVYDLFSKQVSPNMRLTPSIPSYDTYILMYYFVPMIISIILSLVGYKNKNQLRILSLLLNIIVTTYLFIPIGLMIALK